MRCRHSEVSTLRSVGAVRFQRCSVTPREPCQREGVPLPASDNSRSRERALAAAICRGDSAALDEFHERFATPLYRFCYYRVGGSHTDTEEAVQETFLRALEALPRFRGDSALFTWLCGIAKNHIARQRQLRSRERLASALEECDEEIDAILLDLESAEIATDTLERAETHDLVGATLASLPPDYQSALVDKYVHSLPVKEMAAGRRKSQKAIESLLNRSRIAFKRTFELLAGRLREGPRHA